MTIRFQTGTGTPRNATPAEMLQLRTDLGVDAPTLTALIQSLGLGGGATPDATALVNGKVRLAGALGGNAAAPTALGYASQAEVIAAMNAAATAAAGSKVASSSVGATNGVAPLGADSKVAAAYLPSYVDDVLEYANLAAFPVTGETGKIYVTTAAGADPAGTTYRWSGSAYVKLVGSPGSTDAVPEGATNLYFSAARVRAAVLTGIDLATNAAVTAADTVMGAIGKLSARLEALIVTVSNKPDALPYITLTGATTLNRASHGNRQIIFNGASATLTISNDATGLWTGDDAIEVHTATGSAGVPTLVTSDGKSIPGSATKIIGATRKGADAWTVGTTDPAAGGAGADPVTVTGSSVNGSTLTAATAPNWQNTGGNWTRRNVGEDPSLGVNIAGATALTYPTVSADGGKVVTYKSSNIPFIPTGFAVAAAGSANMRYTTPPAGYAETGTGPYTYTLTTAGAFAQVKLQNGTLKFPASAAASFAFRITEASDQPEFFVSLVLNDADSAGSPGFSSWTNTVLSLGHASGVPVNRLGLFNSAGTAVGAVVDASYGRIERAANGDVTASTSNDAGATWTPIGSVVATTAGAPLYVKAQGFGSAASQVATLDILSNVGMVAV